MSFLILHDPSDFFNPLDPSILENILNIFNSHTLWYTVLVTNNFYLQLMWDRSDRIKGWTMYELKEIRFVINLRVLFVPTKKFVVTL